jgi:hypothetical protein
MNNYPYVLLMQALTFTFWLAAFWQLRALIKAIGAYAAWIFMAAAVLVRLLELVAGVVLDGQLVTALGSTVDAVVAFNMFVALLYLCRAMRAAKLG